MSIALSEQCPVTVDQAAVYLKDQGFPADGFNLLKMHLNGVVAQILMMSGRSQIVYSAATAVTEYYRGLGDAGLFLKNAPVQSLDTVTLLPHDTTPVVLTGPGVSVSNTDMWYDRRTGLVTLKGRVFQDHPAAASVTYKAGFDTTDPEYTSLQMLVLEVLAVKWAKWKNQKHGISSESSGQTSITYAPNDFSDGMKLELKRFRRNLFA